VIVDNSMWYPLRFRRVQQFVLDSPAKLIGTPSRPGVEIVRVSHENVHRVADFGRKRYIRTFRSHLCRGQMGLFAAIDQKIVGHAWAIICREPFCMGNGYFRLDHGEALVHFCRVNPEHRRKGIFTALLAELCRRLFDEHAVRRIYGDVLVTDPAPMWANLRVGFARKRRC